MLELKPSRRLASKSSLDSSEFGKVRSCRPLSFLLVRFHSIPLDPAQLDSTQLSSVQLSSAQFTSARLALHFTALQLALRWFAANSLAIERTRILAQ